MVNCSNSYVSVGFSSSLYKLLQAIVNILLPKLTSALCARSSSWYSRNPDIVGAAEEFYLKNIGEAEESTSLGCSLPER